MASVRNCPDDTQLVAEAIELVGLGRTGPARVMLREASIINPRNAKAWLWRASLALDLEEALDCIERVLAIEPDNATARQWLTELKPASRPEDSSDLLEECFLCGHRSSSGFLQCRVCGADLSLDLDTTFSNDKVDERRIRHAIEQLHRTGAALETFDVQYCLGVAHLNLLDPHTALKHFCRAAEMDRRGADLQPVIQALRARPLIMAVDDCKTIRDLVNGTVVRNGYRCLSVGGGVAALSLLKEERPAFVLLDVEMPFMDGYSLCKTIKAQPETKNTTVVMLSGHDGFFDKVKGRMAGASDYLTKPFEPALLLRVIQKYLHRL